MTPQRSEDAVVTASIATTVPERYAKQLAAHLGRRSEVREDPAGRTIVLTDGRCRLQAYDDRLELEVRAPTTAAADRVADVVGRHLERFGRRSGLQVQWTRAEGTG